jgi:hypothetical protein
MNEAAIGSHQAESLSGQDMKTYWEIEDRTSIAISLQDRPGIL